MVQIKIWLSRKENSFKYKGKKYILNDQYSKLKKKIDVISYIVTVILVVLSYFYVDKGKVVYVAVGIMIIVYLLTMFVYIVKFPNDLKKLI